MSGHGKAFSKIVDCEVTEIKSVSFTFRDRKLPTQ